MLKTQFSFFPKRRGLQNPLDPSNKFLSILDTGSVSSKNHEMEVWLYGTNISLNTLKDFWIFEIEPWALDHGSKKDQKKHRNIIRNMIGKIIAEVGQLLW